MSEPILPFSVWDPGTNQNAAPANDNALRDEILNGLVISASTDAQPGSPADGDIYIMTAGRSGAQWSTFDQYDLAIYRAGTWKAYAPTNGIVVNVAGTMKRWNGAAYVDAASGSTRSPSIQAVTSSATVTPTFDDDMVKITAQASALALADPTGTPIPGLGMVIRIKDNGTARAISYGSQYRAIGVTLPTTTVISKTLYLAMIYNSDDTKWDVVAVGQEA